MAEIHLARMRTKTGGRAEVILKRLHPHLEANPELMQMFEDESRLAVQLRHENIARVYDVGKLDGSSFIAVELVRGVNLSELSSRILATTKKRIPAAQALQIGLGVLRALEHAHEAKSEEGVPLNVVHRDVSPPNILASWWGVVKLIDFGIAKAEGQLHRTRAGVMKGKFSYMAPEQLTQETVDARADLFALGEVLYELALGRHPFHGESDAAIMRAAVDLDPPDPVTIDPSCPPALRDLLLRALEKDPADRYPSARVMRRAVEERLQAMGRADGVDPFGRFIREHFSERLLVEERARTLGDDALLLQALRGEGRWKRPASGNSEPFLDLEATMEIGDGHDTLDSTSPPTKPVRPLSLEQEETRPFEQIGAYKLERLLENGPLGEVFSARRHGASGFEKRVVLRRIAPALFADTRFMRELVRQSSLSHPGIEHVLDLDVAGREAYVVTESIDGMNLASILLRSRAARTPIPARIACKVVAEACEGLQGAAAVRLFHGALVPSSIAVAKLGFVKVSFGLARAAAVAAVIERSAEDLRYTAPEVSESSSPSPAADVFSLGAILREMLTSKPPPELDDLLRRALAIDPAERASTAGAFQLALERFIAHTGDPVTGADLASWLTPS
jgi:serine/threonine protein kinase